MSTATFRVTGRFDLGGGAQVATVTIDRAANLFSVRPLGRRRQYTLPLALVAAMACERVIHAELREKQATKTKRKKLRSRVK